MTAIWTNDGTAWRLLSPTDFPDEATLHNLIEEAPQMLPLAGNPSIAILGREVQLGAGYADLVGIELNGRLVVIEIKLARNAEARRAVVAQVLAYAAYLFGMDATSLERDVLGKELKIRGFESLSNAVASIHQGGDFDQDEFNSGLLESLNDGRFRIVLVLDQAPEELIRLVGYLESVSDKILIDLVTISSYMVGGSSIIVPQRVDPERAPLESNAKTRAAKAKGDTELGAELFIARIDAAPASEQEKLRKMTSWAIDLEKNGLCQLATYHNTNNLWTLLPRLRTDNVGLVTIFNDKTAYLAFWRSVFERRAPSTLVEIERDFPNLKIGQGTTCRDISDALFAALTRAYKEANGGSPVEAQSQL
jgi:hypothetical protein